MLSCGRHIMDTLQNNILELEAQILKDREILLNLAKQSKESKNALYEDKINFMKCELDYLQNQYHIIEKQFRFEPTATTMDIAKSSVDSVKSVVLMDRKEEVSETVPTENVVEQIPEISTETKPFKEFTGEEAEKAAEISSTFNLSGLLCEDVNLTTEDIDKMDNIKPEHNLPASEDKAVVKKNPDKKTSAVKSNSLENKIGGIVMAVLAAGLIFVSIVLISLSVIPALGDIVKQVAFYFAGAILVVSGIVMSKKKSLSKLSPLLISIGMGELYVSLFVSNLVFKSLSDWILFVMILVWSASFIFLRKFGTALFNVIGNIGLIVAVYLGFILSANTQDPLKMLFVVLFYFISKLSFYIFFKKRNSIADNLIFHLFNSAELILLVLGNIFNDTIPNSEIRLIILFVCVLLSMVDLIFIIPDKDKNKVFFCLGTIFYGFLYFSLTQNICLGFKAPMFVVILVCFVTLMPFVLVSEFKFKGSFGGTFIEVTFLATQIFCLLLDKNTFAYGFIVLILIPLTILGFIRKSQVMKIFSLLSLAVYAFVPNLPLRIIVGVLFTLAFLLCLYFVKDQYSSFYKIEVIAIDMLYVVTVAVTYGKDCSVQMIIPAIIITGLSLLNLALMYTPLSLNSAKEKDVSMLADILNSVIATVSLCLFLFYTQSPITLLFAAWAFILGLLSMFRGYFKQIHFDKIVSLIIMILLIFRNPLSDFGVGNAEYPEIKLAILGIYFLVNILLLYSNEERYSVVYKFMLTSVSVIVLPFLLHQLALKYSLNGDLASSFISAGTVSAISVSVVGILSLLMSFTFLGKNHNKENDSAFYNTVLSSLLLTYCAYSTYNKETAVEIVWMFILLCVVLVKTFLSSEIIYQIAGFIGAIIMLFADVPAAVSAVYGLITIVSLLVMLYIKKDRYFLVTKILIYCLGLLYILVCTLRNADLLLHNTFLTPGNVILLCLAIHNIVYVFTPLKKNPETDTADFEVLSVLSNHSLVFAALVAAFVQQTPTNILSGLIVIALLPVGLKKFWEECAENTVTYVFSLTECTLIPFLLCYAWGTSGVVANIVAIVISLVYIVLGFVFSHKIPRLYGLVVTIILIFKMILIDFKHSSMLGYALGFLVAGVICLSISLIYNIINKKME